MTTTSVAITWMNLIMDELREMNDEGMRRGILDSLICVEMVKDW